MTPEEMAADIASRLSEEHLVTLIGIKRNAVEAEQHMKTLLTLQRNHAQAWTDIQGMKLCAIQGMEFVFSPFGAAVAALAQSTLEVRWRLDHAHKHQDYELLRPPQ